MKTIGVDAYINLLDLILKRKLTYRIEITLSATKEEYQEYQKMKKDYVFGEIRDE